MILRHGYVEQRAARQKRTAEERAAKERELAAKRKSYQDGIRDERERTTAVIGVGETHILIGERPKHRELIVPLSRTDYPHYFDPREIEYRYARIPTVRFRPVRKAWASGQGHTVVWFDWEFVG